MTISKAYSHLELEGMLERKSGIGMLVKANIADMEKRLELLDPAVKELMLQAKQLNLDLGQVIDRIKQTTEAQ